MTNQIIRQMAPMSCVPTNRFSASGLPAVLRLIALWRSRRALAGLTPTQLDDIGVTADAAAQEAARKPWDVPAHWRT